MTIDTLDLTSLHLFEALSEDQWQRLLKSAVSSTLSRDDILFRMGSESRHFHYLKSGQMKIARTSPQGAEKVLSIARPGQLFAEAVMFFENTVYPASASALCDSEVISFDSETFLGFLQESPELSMAMLRNLSIKLHTQIVEIDNLTLQNATFRTLNFINSLVSNDATRCAQVDLPAAKHIIASQLSITPETLSRSLTELSTKGLIRPVGNGRQLEIPDLVSFREFMISG